MQRQVNELHRAGACGRARWMRAFSALAVAAGSLSGVQGATLAAPAALAPAAPPQLASAEEGCMASTSDRVVISFLGYQRLPQGRGRLFVHFSARPELMLLEAGGIEHRYRFVDTDIGVRNNRHPLDLREFEELLVHAQLTPSRSDVILTLRLRRASDLPYELVELEDGHVSLQIDLPAR